jgi:hypothetical protein
MTRSDRTASFVLDVFSVFPIFSMPDHPSTPSAGPVHLTVDELPLDVAEEIREVQAQDPEFLRRVLLYGITHKTVFETLSRNWRG